MVSAACWIGPDRRLNAITRDAATRTVSPAASSNFRSEVRIPRRPAATVAPGTFWAIIEASLHAAHVNARLRDRHRGLGAQLDSAWWVAPERGYPTATMVS